MPADFEKVISLAIVGYGLIGRRHAQVISALSNAELVAVVESEGSAARVSVDSSIQVFSDIKQMLDDARPDGVIIASPTKLHMSHAKYCIDAGVPVLIEKPICDDLAAARELTSIAHELDVAILVGHHRRYNSIIRQAHDLIKSGAIGDVRAVNVMCWFYKPDHYFDEALWRQKGGAGPVSVNLIHDIDLLRYLCGDVVAVQAQFTSAKRGFENEDLGTAILSFKSGAVGTVTVSDSIVSPWSWELTSGENPAYPETQQSTYFIGGSKGSISLPDLTVWKHEGDRDWWNPMHADRIQRIQSDPLVEQILHFCDVVSGQEAPLVSGVEGTKSLQVIDAIQRAAVTQELVQLDDYEMISEDIQCSVVN